MNEREKIMRKKRSDCQFMSFRKLDPNDSHHNNAHDSSSSSSFTLGGIFIIIVTISNNEIKSKRNTNNNICIENDDQDIYISFNQDGIRANFIHHS